MENVIIGQLVAQDYRTAALFEKYGIDFCCNGNRTIEDACRQKKIDQVQLTKELEQLTQQQDTQQQDFNTWPINQLADYIVEKHHGYVNKQIPVLQAYLKKIDAVHGDRHTELATIARLFDETATELTVHMKKEELMLFPQIKKMFKSQQEGNGMYTSALGSFQNPISLMMHEHAFEGERFAKISALSKEYTAPEDSCNTYRVTFALLKEFETDLHLHIHLENNILFPKALEMENHKN
jgi:regulator of cell morphogenesis and NO signaling